jgi:hypothetical protein
LDRLDRRDEGGRRISGGGARRFRIDTPRKLEQIVALGPRKRQRLRNAAQRLGRGLNRAALFDPRTPGHADAGPLGELLAPETRRPPPAGRRCRRHALAMSAHEFAEQPSLIRFEHGSYCNRIRFNVVTV